MANKEMLVVSPKGALGGSHALGGNVVFVVVHSPSAVTISAVNTVARMHDNKTIPKSLL